MSNFPQQKGFAVGMVKGFFGLASAFSSQFYITFFKEQANADAKFVIGYLGLFPFPVRSRSS
jgi:hypothetical protein